MLTHTLSPSTVFLSLLPTPTPLADDMVLYFLIVSGLSSIALTMAVNHGSLRHCYRVTVGVTSLCLRDRSWTYPRPSAQLRYHFLMMVAYMVASIMPTVQFHCEQCSHPTRRC